MRIIKIEASCCGDCPYYDWKKHRCSKGATEGPAADPFYSDCPVDCVVPCKDCKHFDTEGFVSEAHKGWCKALKRVFGDDFFCATGEKVSDVGG